MIYSFYVYRRDGVCLYRINYNTPTGKSSVSTSTPEDEEAEDEREKLVFGMAFSLKELITQLSPMDGSGKGRVECPLGTVKTKQSTMHSFETLTGLR
jgi:hypothetical protein